MSNIQLSVLLVTILAAAAGGYLMVRRLVHAVVRDVWLAVKHSAAIAERATWPRRPLPLTAATPVKPGQCVSIKAEILLPFSPERIFVSEYDRGTGRGARDWIVNDIKVDGRSQFCQAGDIPGEMFSAGAVDGFVSFDVATKEVTLNVTYIGKDPEGMPFYGSMVGGVAPKTLAQPAID